MLRDLQAAFGAAVTGGDAAGILALTGRDARTEARLAIHRGNFQISLVNVLAATFPAVRRSVDAALFERAAAAFADACPPRRPELLGWGGEFPDFLARAAALTDRPWLADLARLDWARNEAIFAADATPLAPADLAAVPAERYKALRLDLLPSARLVASVFPVATLWDAAMAEPAGGAAADAPGEGVLVLRPARIVRQRTVSAGDRALLAALADGRPLAAAAEAAFTAEPDFDLMAALAAHLTGGTFAGFTIGTDT